MKKRLAIYPGSFNPFTKGHFDILTKAESIFDEVIVVVGNNPEKNSDGVDKIKTLELQLPGKKVEKFSGFLVDYVYQKEDDGYDVTVVRGLRNGADLDYEVNMLRVIEDQKPNIKMVFLVCDRKFEHISSSMVRSMEKIQEGSGSEYVVKPEVVLNKKDKFEQKTTSPKKNDINIYSHVRIVPENCKMDDEFVNAFNTDMIYVVAEIDNKQRVRVYGSTIFLPKNCFNVVDNFEINVGDVVVCVETTTQYSTISIGKKYYVSNIRDSYLPHSIKKIQYLQLNNEKKIEYPHFYFTKPKQESV